MYFTFHGFTSLHLTIFFSIFFLHTCPFDNFCHLMKSFLRTHVNLTKFSEARETWKALLHTWIPLINVFISLDLGNPQFLLSPYNLYLLSQNTLYNRSKKLSSLSFNLSLYFHSIIKTPNSRSLWNEITFVLVTT